MWTEGTGSNPPYPEENPMAKVTYRGVEYATDRVTPSNKKEVRLTYRGVKTVKQLSAV